MPFDNSPTVTPADLVPPVPERPDARFLSRVLRDGPTGLHWPVGFEWDYGHCTTCAMGVAARLWSEISKSPYWPAARAMATESGEKLGLSGQTGRHVFYDLWAVLDIPADEITPTHVADALDAAIAQRDTSVGAA